MTINYCGRCGSANGINARFCRQCGIELSGQAALSSPSAPLNVEFSAKTAPKEAYNQTSIDNQSIDSEKETDAEGLDSAPDLIGISESLRHVRKTSGPLIIEATKKKKEEMEKIIAQAIEGMENERNLPKAGDQIIESSDKTEDRVEIQTDSNSASQAIAPSQKSRTQGQSNPRPIVAVSPLSSQTGISQGTGRRSMGVGSVGMTPVTITHTGLPNNVAQLPLNGPSSVLAQASGLNTKPGFGSKFRIGVITLALLLGIGIYFAVRDKILTPSVSDIRRDLLRVEDQSDQLIRLGEHDREQGRFDTAMGYFQQALALTPNNPNVHFLIAQTHSNAGQSDEALRAYKQLLRIAPEHLEARLQVAQIYQARGNWTAAYQEYQRIIALNQNSGQAAAALEAIELYEAGKPQIAANAAKARNSKTAAKKGAVLPQVGAAQAEISLLPQRFETAPGIRPPASFSGNKADENPDPRTVAESRKNLGLRYYNVKEFRAAINEFLFALRLTPEDKDIYYFLGSAYYGMGQFALAHDYYKRVDRGQYVQVARSGAQRTEKAAREEFKRRMETLKNEASSEIRNEVKKDSEGKKGFLNLFK